MKRFLTIAALTAVAGFALAACGKRAEETTEGGRTVDTGALPEQTTAPTPDPVLPAAPPPTTPAASGTTAPTPPPPTLPTDPTDPPADTMGPPPKS